MTTGHDRELLVQAYQQAARASGNSDPNPSVGAIITDPNGNILARGYTQRAGYAHAERHALAQLTGTNLSGCTMHVTLEPCCHHGRTPPCVDAIIEHKIARVVISQRDFAAEVQGRTVDLLRAAGVEVIEWNPEDFRLEKWLTTNPFFFARSHNRPRVLLKWAQTADGYLAPHQGPSGPISGAMAATTTALFRFASKLTMAAPGTVQTDNPRLNVRLPDVIAPEYYAGFSPFMQHFLISQAELARSVQTGQFEQTAVRLPERYLLLPENSSEPLFGDLPQQQPGLPVAHVTKIARADWHNDFSGMFQATLQKIGRLGFNSVLVEAGPVFSQKLIENGFADGLLVYRSRAKDSTQLWGKPGRANSLSRALAENDAIHGYHMLEQVSLDDDDLLLMAADRSL